MAELGIEIPAAFATPSYTWPGLKGQWPLLFNILTPMYSDIKGGFRTYTNAAADGTHRFHSYEAPGFLIPADTYEAPPAAIIDN